MKHLPACFLLCALPVLPVALGGEEAPLDPEIPLLVYLSADTDSPLLATLSVDEDRWTLRSSIPVDEEQAAAGWRAVEFTHPVMGYVLAENVTKDLEVRAESPVFAERETSVDVMLTILEDPDEAEVLEMEKNWASVRVETSLIGFAQRSEWEERPEPEAPLETVETTTPEETPEPDEDLFADAEEVEITSSERATAPPSQPRRTLQTADGETVTGTMRFYEGYLNENRGFWGRSPEYAFSLTNQRGRRLADLDTSNLLLTTNLRKQAGRQIMVQGILRDDEDRRIPVLVIESLHLP